jgi:hypothetical protein
MANTQTPQLPIEGWFRREPEKGEKPMRDIHRSVWVPDVFQQCVKRVTEEIYVTDKIFMVGSLFRPIDVRLCYITRDGSPFFVRKEKYIF